MIHAIAISPLIRNSAVFTTALTIFVLSVVAGSEAGVTEQRGSSSPVSKKPNVIFVIADQWNAQSLGYAGNKDVKTPNLDRLAKESVVFSTAVAANPVCSPSRASLLTGQYPLTHGVFYNDKPLSDDALTIAEIYKQQGYSTGFIGKWHVNGHPVNDSPFSYRDKPVPQNRRQGFDYWKVREVTHDYNASFYFDENDQKHFWQGYDAFAQTDSAIQYIHRKREKPFLLFLAWGPPHNPYATAPAEYSKLYDPQTIKLRENIPDSLQDKARKDLAGYYAHCTALDKAMGDLLKALEKEGLSKNTILVFTSDHGDMLYSQGMIRKQKPWDESILVPLIIRYPGKLGNKPRAIKTPINNPDILPTLLALSNISIPRTIEGKDFSKIISGAEKAPEDEAALIQLPVPFHEFSYLNGGKEYRAIRTSRYTYARDIHGPWLLYDNQADPFQKNNLVGQAQYTALQQKMEVILKDKLRQVHDEFLPADEYMKKWGYRYDFKDSLRHN